MTISSAIFTETTSGSISGKLFFRIKNFLVSLGWTVAGSGDGSGAGGMDAVDRYDLATAQVDDAWVVLQSPHAAPSDRIQFALQRTGAGANPNRGTIVINPAADFTGGGATTLPSSSFSRTLLNDVDFSAGATSRIALTGDDTPPYGFASIVYVPSGSGDPDACLLIVPLEQAPANAGKPYVIYARGNGGTSNMASSSLRAYATSTATGYGAAELSLNSVPVPSAFFTYNNTGVVVPQVVELNPDGEDLSFPAPVFVDSGGNHYVGMTNFVQWKGSARASLQTLSDRSRIVFGDLIVPWDGATVPEV